MMSKVSLKLLAACVAFLCFPLSMIRAEEASDQIAELKKLREKIPTLHVVATSITRSASGTRESRIEIWEKNADGKQLFKRWVTAITEPGTPKQQTAAPSLMVKDGRTAWREMDLGDRKLVFKGKPEVHNEYSDMEPLRKGGVVRINEGGNILDQPCILLEIREKANPEDIIASYWISKSNGLVLKSIVESTGATITEFKVSELKLDEAMPDSLFNYKPAGDAQILEDKSTNFRKSD